MSDFDDALAAHGAGRLEEAERGYRAVLARQPKHADAWHLLGMIAHQSGHPEKAVSAIQRALKAGGPKAAYLTNLGVILATLNRTSEAAAALEQAVALDPTSYAAVFALASTLALLGKLPEAEAQYRKAITLEAGNAAAYNNLGSVLQSQGRNEDAATEYRRAIGLDPKHARAHYNLGTALKALNNLDAAAQSFRAALFIAPDLAEAHVNLGTILHDQGDVELAITHARHAIDLNPRDAVAHNNLGAALRDAGQLDAARQSYARAIALNPALAEARHNDGVALQRLGREDDAIESYRQAQELKGGFAEPELNAALLLLMRGDFAAGWKAYESRWQKGQDWRFSYPLWQGEKGGTVLVWGEQGVGDEVLCAGMMPDMMENNAVVMEVDKRLTALFARSFVGAQVIGRQSPPDPATRKPDIAWHTPFAGLGRWLRPTAASFPKRTSYLRADEGRRQTYRAILEEGGPRAIVGITWGSSNATIGRRKSINLGQWMPILETPGIKFVDLQYGDTASARTALEAETGVPLTHLPNLDLTDDLDGVAALAGACDLVISVSSATAHIAAALGCPTWVLVPVTEGNLWVWMREGDHTPWYPSVKIFRQRESGHWPEVMMRVKEALHAYIANGPQLQQIN